MVYVGSANTAAIMAQLPDHPHILLLYNDPWGCYLAGPNATVPPLVADRPRTVDSKVCLAFPDVRLVQIDICTMSCQHLSLHDCNGSLVGLKALKPVTQCQATPAFIPQ